MSDPNLNLTNLRNWSDEMVFENYGFDSYARPTCIAASYLVMEASQMACFDYYGKSKRVDAVPECVLVVDCGYSFTRIIPHINGLPVNTAIKQ
jgi:actin-related protein 6